MATTKRSKSFTTSTLLFLLMVGLVGGALAADTSHKRIPQEKGTAHVRTNMVFDALEGGETVADAVVIGALPFTDTGATCDNLDDYDEACPFLFSTSPDVVYSFTPPADMLIQIDLCGSGYDTKLYVYENAVTSGSFFACNEDYYPSGDACGEFNAALFNLQIYGGNTYYIVIDGYAGDCGAYQLLVDEYVFIPSACTGACPPNGIFEAEPDMAAGYVDAVNAGCNVAAGGPVFQRIGGWDGLCGTLCANSGWYDTDFRDTDWFYVEAADYEISFSVYADYGVTIRHLAIPDCSSVVTLHSASGSCEWVNVTFATFPGEFHYLYVSPEQFSPPEGAPEDFTFQYFAEVCGIADSHVAMTDPTVPPQTRIHAHPNPFNPMTTISFTLPAAGAVSLVIYDVTGRQVATLVDGTLRAGEHTSRWDGRERRGAEAPSGIYFARLATQEGIRTEKLALIR